MFHLYGLCERPMLFCLLNSKQNWENIWENENRDAAGQVSRHHFRSKSPVRSQLDVRNTEAAWRKFKRLWNNYKVAKGWTLKLKNIALLCFWHVQVMKPPTSLWVFQIQMTLTLRWENLHILCRRGKWSIDLWHFCLQQTEPRGKRHIWCICNLSAQVCQNLQFNDEWGAHAQGQDNTRGERWLWRHAWRCAEHTSLHIYKQKQSWAVQYGW